MGPNGTLTFDGDWISITRTGALARMSVGNGEKRILVNSITAVQWKSPGALVNGFIAFILRAEMRVDCGSVGRRRMPQETRTP